MNEFLKIWIASFLILILLLTSCNYQDNEKNLETDVDNLQIQADVQDAVDEENGYVFLTYNQSPFLDNLDLPAIEDRLPQKPKVIEPLDSIGSYGGTIHKATTAVFDYLFLTNNGESFISLNYPTTKGPLEPNIADEWYWNDEGTELTFHIREGIRWSDGMPLTTEDVLFTWNDIWMEPETNHSIPGAFLLNEEAPKLKIIDVYTFSLTYTEPYYYAETAIASLTTEAIIWPKHLVEHYHPKYSESSTWDLFNREMGSLSGKRGAVTLYPWYVKETIPGDRIILSRNPYYWKVDSEGNQLPYVDEIIFYILEDRDIVAQEAIKGELDTDGMWINGSHLQMLMSNMEEEKFEIGWWRGVPSGAIYFNMAVEDELLQEIFRDPYFRHAASILINREKINWNVYNGFLDITGSSFHRTTPYFTEETARKWVRFDVQRAKEILEEAGYLDTDLDGIYEAPNGRKLSLTVQVSEDNELYTRTLEQMKEDYAKGGIEIIIDRQSHEQVSENLLTNQWDMRIWDGNGFDNPLLYNDYLIDWGSDDYSGANWNRYDSLNPLEGYANFQKLIQNAAHLPYDERVETLKEANNILAEECWILYMGSYVRPYYIGKNIRNHPVEAVRQDVSTPFMLYQTYLVDE